MKISIHVIHTYSYTLSCAVYWCSSTVAFRLLLVDFVIYLNNLKICNSTPEGSAVQCKVTCNNCNMGTRDLPDIYARSPRAAGLRAEGIHIRQITRAHVTSNMYHF